MKMNVQLSEQEAQILELLVSNGATVGRKLKPKAARTRLVELGLITFVDTGFSKIYLITACGLRWFLASRAMHKNKKCTN